jgi:hypothetical protein
MIANDQIRNLFLALNDMKYALKYGADMLGLAWDLRCARIGVQSVRSILGNARYTPALSFTPPRS